MNYNDNKYLTQELKRGNEAAFNHIINLHYSNLCTYAIKLCKDRFHAEDIVQNILIKFWQKHREINIYTNIKSYLYKSVYNEFIDQHRKKKELESLTQKHIESIHTSARPEEIDYNQISKIVNKEIKELPNKCREIFLLNKKEGLTHEEIANYLNISVKTVESHITRAFKTLNTRLSSHKNIFFILLFRKFYSRNNTKSS